MSKYKLPKVEDLLEAGVHFGHQVRRWHPKMEPYIYSVKNSTHIIDLEQTESGLKKAAEFLYETAKKGGQIILVGTKKQAREIVGLEAKRCGAMFVTERWLGGTLTNYRLIRKNADKLLNLLKKRETGELNKYTKKERLLIDREIEKLEKFYGGIVNLRGMPQAIFVVDVKREKTAVREAQIAGVPLVGLVDTNSDPTGINHIIPGNDDAIKSVVCILKTIGDAIETGYKEFEKETKAVGVAAKAETKVESVEQEKEAVSYTESAHVVDSPVDLVAPEVPLQVEVPAENTASVESEEKKSKKPASKAKKS